MEPNPRGWQSPNCSLRSGVNARGHFLFPPMYQRIGGIGGESTEACLPRPALTDVQIERAQTLYVEVGCIEKKSSLSISPRVQESWSSL